MSLDNRSVGQLLLLCFLIIMGTGCNPKTETADLILVNGKVASGDQSGEFFSAFAVKDGRFLAVGSDEQISQYEGPGTEVIDAGGRTVIPGLNDSHNHVVRGGRFYNLELRWDGINSLEQGLRMIREQAKHTPEGQWVRVIGGWSPYQFEEKRFPTFEELNEVAPDTPVFVLFLYSRGFLNQAGIDALGITAETEPPPGSRYEIGRDGKPTGVLLAEPNPTILYQTIGALPQLSEEEQANSTRHFYRELNRFGLTSAIDAGGGGHLFPVNYVGTQQLADAGEMPLRISYYLFPQRPGRELEDFRDWTSNYEVDNNKAEGLENGYVLEGGGEFLVWSAGDFENFMAPRPDLNNRPGWRDELNAVAEHLVSNQWPFRIHATYGESITQILDLFEDMNRETPFGDLRWAIDHAETLYPEDIERIKRLGNAGIAIQSRMAYAGEFFAERYGKEAAEQAPPVRALLEAGIPVGAGTDGTRVGSYNPWPALFWLVTGKTVGGMQLFSEENKLSRLEALQLYTSGSAWFSGEQDVKGTIATGMYADFAVLTEDYFTIPEEQIMKIESVLTVVGGNIVYGKNKFVDLVPALPPVRPGWSPVSRFGGYGAPLKNEYE